MDKKSTQQKRSSLRDLAYVFFRRKWVITAVVLATVIPVTIYTFRLPDTYKAESRIYVKPGRENIYMSPVTAPAGMNPPTIVQRVQELIKTEIEILRSRVLLKRVVAQIGIAKLFPRMLPNEPGTAHAKESRSLEVAVDRALGNLSVDRVEGADVLEVAFKSHDPDVASDFVNTLGDLYVERHLEIHRRGESYDFFKSQSNQLEQKLKSSARQLAEFRKKYSIVSFDQRKNLTLTKYMDMLAMKQSLETEHIGLQKRIERLKKDLGEVSETQFSQQMESSDGPVVGNLKVRLAELELQKSDLLHKYKPDNYEIVRLDEAIAKIKETLAREEEKFHGSVSTAASGLYLALQGELISGKSNLKVLEAKQVEVEKQLIEYGQELERLSRLEPQLRALERTISVNEQNYKLYLTKFEESRVSDALDAAKMVSVSIIEPATPPLRPIPANRKLNIFVSICLGGVAGLFLAFLIEYFDHTLKVPEDIMDSIKIPLLGTIENLPEKEKQDLKAIAISPKPPSYYQILKNNVVMHAEDKGIKMVALCSSTSKEGCSTIALNLAASLAKDKECRVVLVDTNLRQPSLHTSLDVPVSPGFSDVIHEGIDVHAAIKESAIPNLFILTSGVTPANPSVTFESSRLVDMIEVLGNEFDWVIFDSPPVNDYSDSTLLAPRLDAVIMVVQAENKRAEVAIQAKERLEEAGAKIIGAVLNRRRFVIPEIVYRRLS
jgi:capsular exopolysaccharide synthesis family protein